MFTSSLPPSHPPIIFLPISPTLTHFSSKETLISPPLLSPTLQVRWTKTAGSASDKFQETSIYNETLRIEGIQRVQGGRYYCKADNGVGVAAIKSIRVDVQCKWARATQVRSLDHG